MEIFSNCFANKKKIIKIQKLTVTAYTASAERITFRILSETYKE